MHNNDEHTDYSGTKRQKSEQEIKWTDMSDDETDNLQNLEGKGRASGN